MKGSPCPFVGARPLRRGDPLHGRAREIAELFHRLVARRIVVLHAPSGAGKTSLVRAGLVPRLEGGGFDVWAPVRLDLDPREVPGVGPGVNRYLFSALSSLEEEVPEEHRRGAVALAGLDLPTYLATRPRRKARAGQPVVLIFDAFEEILTVAPHAIDEKLAFFDDLGRALEDPAYFALFIVREDHLAAFAPFRDRVPTQLAETVRLGPLGREAAQDTAEKLAAAGGRAFPGAAALVDLLASVPVHGPDGRATLQVGPTVEPLLLQIVCRRLWGSLPPTAQDITAADVADRAGAAGAFAEYYAASVAAVSGGDVVIERAVREWFGSALIQRGVRSQVRRGPGRSDGLANEHIEALLATTLVRAEQRVGATWFELVHDRLIPAVEEDNRAWEAAHLHPAQVQAKLWEAGHRPPSLLLAAEALPAAVRWASAHPERVTEVEAAFVAQSSARRAAQVLRRRVLLGMAGGAITLLATAVLGLQVVRMAEARAEDDRVRAASAEIETTRAQARRDEADRARAAADAEAAGLRAAAAMTEVERLRRTLEDLQRSTPKLRTEVAGLAAEVSGLRWGILAALDTNHRVESEIARDRLAVTATEGEIGRLRAKVEGWSFDESELHAWETESERRVAALAAEADERRRRRDAAVAANESLRQQLIAAGLRGVQEPHPVGDVGLDGIPDVEDLDPIGPHDPELGIAELRRELQKVQDESRRLELLRDDLTADRERLEAEAAEAATRGAALKGELTAVRRQLAAADASEKQVAAQADELEGRKQEMRDRSIGNAQEILRAELAGQRVDLEIAAWERENEAMTRVLEAQR